MYVLHEPPWKHHHFGFKFKTSPITFPSLGTLTIMCCDHFSVISKERINSHMLVTGKNWAELILQVVIQVVYKKYSSNYVYYMLNSFLFGLRLPGNLFESLEDVRGTAPLTWRVLLPMENTPTFDAFLPVIWKFNFCQH